MHAVNSTSIEKDVISLTFHQTMLCTSIVIVAVAVQLVVVAVATTIYCGNSNQTNISY